MTYICARENSVCIRKRIRIALKYAMAADFIGIRKICTAPRIVANIPPNRLTQIIKLLRDYGTEST